MTAMGVRRDKAAPRGGKHVYREACPCSVFRPRDCEFSRDRRRFLGEIWRPPAPVLVCRDTISLPVPGAAMIADFWIYAP
jgi:hypothetical protein